VSDLIGVPNEPRQFFTDILENGPRRGPGAVAPVSPTSSPAGRRAAAAGRQAVGDDARPALARLIAGGPPIQSEPMPAPAPRSERPGAPGRNRRRLVVRLAGFITSASAALTLAAAPWNDDAGRPTGPPASSKGAATEAAKPSGGFLDSVDFDSEPVRPGEFFRDARVTVNGRTYTRVARRLDAGCPDRAGVGAAILAGDRCRQLVRAIYASDHPSRAEPASGKVFTSVAVVVADTRATAALAAANADTITVRPPEVPVGGETDITGAIFDHENSLVTASARGHYLILTEVPRVGGAPRGAADAEPLRVVADDLRLVAAGPIEDRAASAGAG
jgi:hypothetical protein